MENIADAKIIVIDNYDSFTYNLVHYLGELGAEIEVFRNDKISVDEIENFNPKAIILSPGPCTPTEAGICVELVQKLGSKTPIFGVCLGLQSIAQAYGAKVVASPTLMHGKVSDISHEQKGVFDGLQSPFKATRYHSLCVSEEKIPQELEITAKTKDGVIMGMQHKSLPVHGVQFHPESIASEHGHDILKNFLTLASEFNQQKRTASLK